jgi:HD-GYP domain-containing protein (c-di-GMP phosphodiesterase class II)
MTLDTNLKTKLYIIIISVNAFFLFLYLVSLWDYTLFEIFPFLFFLFLNIAAESMPVQLPRGLYVSVSFATIFASILLFQPLEVVVLTACGYLFSVGKEKVIIKYIFNASQLVLCSGLAALFLRAMGGVDLTGIGVRAVMVLLITSSMYYLINALLVTMVVSLSHGEEPYSFFISNIKWSTPNFLCLAPLGLLVTLIYQNVGGWGLILFFIPLLLARHSFKSYMDMRQSFLDTIHSLTTAIDAKDSYTKGHSSRVADYVDGIARELGYNITRLERLRFISLLHDAGKIGIREHVLNKPAALTRKEFTEMQRHSVLGAEIIKNVSLLSEGEKIVRHHHERYDGGGYPDGLKGQDIPEGARIVCVADAFDAMTSTRPYRKALSTEAAMDELIRCAGSQFDPRMVEAFIKAHPNIQMTVWKKDLSMVEAAAAREWQENSSEGEE